MFEMNRAKKYATTGEPTDDQDQPLICNGDFYGNEGIDDMSSPPSPDIRDADKNGSVPRTLDRFKGLAKKASANEPPIASNNNQDEKVDENANDATQATPKPENDKEKSNKNDTGGEPPRNTTSDTGEKDETEHASKASKSFRNAVKKSSDAKRPLPDLHASKNADDDSSRTREYQLSPINEPSSETPDAEKDAVNKATNQLNKQKMRLKLKEQMKKIVEERLSVKQIFQRYVEASTLHGFRYTCSDTYLIRRAIWAILMLLGATYFLWKLERGVGTYLSRPFSTLSTLDYVNNLDFPAISICLVNQFNYSKVLQSPKMKRLYMDGRLPLRSNWQNVTYDIDGDLLVKELKNTSFAIGDILVGCDYINRDTVKPSKANDTLNKRKCSVDNFTEPYFSETGKVCYTLNSHKKGHQKLNVSLSGLKSGYELTFDLHNADAIMTDNFAALQVVIHHPNELVTANTGFMIPTGFRTYVDMQSLETTNLPPPYATKCGEKKLKYFKVYNQKACILEQLTIYTGDKCGCRDTFMPDNGLPYCNLKQIFSCMYPAQASFNKFGTRDTCPLDCKVVKYNKVVTNSKFLHNPPTGLNPDLLKQRVEKFTGDFSTENHLYKISVNRTSDEELDRYIEDNLAVVIFFFGKMAIHKNEQEVSFDFYQFLGDMGGEIGLMLGASLLTFVEFVDLFLFLLYHQLLRLNKRKVRKSSVRKAEKELLRAQDEESMM